MTKPIPCMGGWCKKREACENYHAQSQLQPVERLCGKEDDPEIIREVEEENERLLRS